MKKAPGVLKHQEPKALTNKSVPIEKMITEYNDDEFIHEKLKELDARCREITESNLGKDADYAVVVIRKICSEIALMKLTIAVDRPYPGWYAFDGRLLRNVASIVFKMELLATKYFAESYKRYTYISSDNKCKSRDELYRLADEWLSDRRTMADVVSAMLDEIQGLGITANTELLERSEAGDPLLDILGDLHPAKFQVGEIGK